MRIAVLAFAVLVGCSSSSKNTYEEVRVDSGAPGSGGQAASGGSAGALLGSGGSAGAGVSGSAGSMSDGGSGTGGTGGSASSAVTGGFAGSAGSSGSSGSSGSAGAFTGGRGGSAGSLGTAGAPADAGDAAASCSGKLDCDSFPGCESTNGTSRACGSCGHQCDPRESCYQGTTCTLCPVGYMDCDGDPKNTCETNVPAGKDCYDVTGGCGDRCHTWQTCTGYGTCV
jgi:hypothetical protein